MNFNVDKFQQTSFTQRKEAVTVAELKPFCDGEGEPLWTVRGLNGEELALVDEAEEKAKNLLAMTEAAVGPDEKKKVEALRELLGVSKDMPVSLIRRLEILILGSVEPKVDRQLAVKLAECYPMEFRLLFLTILKLSGKGKVPGKLPGSGTTPKSEPPATSASSEDDSSLR